MYFAPSQSARSFTLKEKEFVLDTLNDKRAWHGPRWASVTESTKSAWTISLETDAFIRQVTQEDSKASLEGLSVTFMGPRVTWFSFENWTSVPRPVQQEYSRKQYRVYVLLHECGHALGLDHFSKSELDRLTIRKAPVMLQQTRGLQGFTSNVWPTDYEQALLK